MDRDHYPEERLEEEPAYGVAKRGRPKKYRESRKFILHWPKEDTWAMKSYAGMKKLSNSEYMLLLWRAHKKMMEEAGDWPPTPIEADDGPSERELNIMLDAGFDPDIPTIFYSRR